MASSLVILALFQGRITSGIHECNETDVRLVDGQISKDGQVQICMNGL